MAVDEDVVDRLILEQRFERTEAGHLIEDFRYEVVELLGVECEPLDQHVLRHELLNMAADFLFWQLFQRQVYAQQSSFCNAGDGFVDLCLGQQTAGRRQRPEHGGHCQPEQHELVELGNYYCEQRQVPPDNVLLINWTGGNTCWSSDDFQTNLLTPLLEHAGGAPVDQPD